MKRALVLLAAMATMTAACDANGPATTGAPQPTDLAGTRWVATAMYLGGAPVPFVLDARPTLDFDEDGRSLGGTTGCNSYFGEYRLGDGTITIGGLGQTEMACENDLMRQEADVIAVLQGATIYTVADGVLTIGRVGGSTLEFEAREVAFPDAELTGTEWIADTIITGPAASTLVPGSRVTLFIDAAASEARGSAGCNTYTAGVEWDRTQLTFGQVSATEMACQGEGIMEQEQFVLDLLRGELAVVIDGARLTLTAPDGRGLGFSAAG